MKIGDIVTRVSYDRDIAFKVIDIVDTDKGEVYKLSGISIRILADAYYDDLVITDAYTIGKTDEIFTKKVQNSMKKIINNRERTGGYRSTRSNTPLTNVQVVDNKNSSDKNELFFGKPGKVLHLDGDSDYLENCLKAYRNLSIEVDGFAYPEKDHPSVVVNLVKKYRPDIVVLTGHDGMVKDAKDYTNIDNYKNSKYFVESVKVLREYESGYDDLIIFAGACQSYYEAILSAGANYSSSPNRVLIHCFDPVFLAEKIAYTSFEKVLSIEEALENSITGTKGIGGLQTRGKFRQGFPKSLYL
ncbi:MAG: sporulation peptidase YabG [Oscillospiraceae bacterium]|nr:sporulation peptidase YabG [Oscillospiraceae bacterium]